MKIASLTLLPLAKLAALANLAALAKLAALATLTGLVPWPFAAVLIQGSKAIQDQELYIAARGNETIITWDELDELLVARRALSQDGRETLRHLAEVKMLEVIGAETGLAATDAAVDAQMREIEKQIAASGDKGGLEKMLREKRVTLAEFRNLLKLASVQETMTRRALGLKDGERVTGEQQKLWMDDALLQRKYEEYNPPWKEGLVARSASFTITETEFIGYLRLRLPPDVLLEDCWQLLLAKRMKQRMPDLAPERFKKAVADEIQRRRDDTKRDPRYKGATWESLLATQGVMADRMERDPGVQIAALSKLWVERSYDDASLQRVYKDRRELFDGAYGAAVDTMMIFVRAAAFKNEFNPRTFAEGDKLLMEWRLRIRTADEFQKLAKERSEDAQSREASGALGYITARTAKVPAEILHEVTKALATNPSAAAQESMVGPLRVPDGCVLLWFGSRRPAPVWDAMAGYVKSELRREFVEDVLPKSAVSGPALAREP